MFTITPNHSLALKALPIILVKMYYTVFCIPFFDQLAFNFFSTN